MQVTFTSKGGKTHIGTVVSEGFFIVDGVKSCQIHVDALPHVEFVIPVDACKAA